ncbi:MULTISPECIES: type VI secretion protein IcmF/TssM N-terminal domain-containing protein [unclassified Caballeronia]|uniref:type VI secretion protein IcmF/TssM N-terminal domain-containing protein n=1 Tax=unclassified Caballeronia TaxID=2646786 RepID=UPI0028624982|nr:MULTISPECIES: type VI secretion protein IcmF/TssM N-terminal domain-containing protein [unclassified Caballeronia]MDR5815338.1 type VI secretion protein IcmF/TssM N-terminal domain-containing protein [Caballeronia sp. LZ033]MDR5821696.1 type VI secretion protein IcmF/TssM N-terminal domain-containing protein [Caballeronia sp. LZ043]
MLTSNLFLLSIGVLTLVVLAVLGAVVYFALHGSHAKPQAERKIVRLRSDSLRSAFRQAVELIEGNIATRAERYNIPWVMILNEGDDPRPLPIAQAGVASVLGADASSLAATDGISWHFFDRGIVVDIKAAYLGSPDDDEGKPWDEFLSLCRNYRPQRPFDSVVITVPAATLLADDTDARLELVRHAKLAHRRLWLAQNRFAMRFAVYVVVTGCDALPGFATFARALPEPLRASMLGWSSPYDLSTTYQPGWVDTAMNSVMRSVSDASAELFALDPAHLDARQFLQLPSRIDAMRAQLQSYVDELLRASAYHEPFFFRGIYLTGDASEFAQWSVAQDAMTAAPEALPGDEAPEAEHELGDGRREPNAHINDLMLQPAFLRDLFEKKIFSEYGLTRPSRSQHLTRPVLNRALRWGGVALLGGWGIGLVVATAQLSHRNGELVAALGSLHRDAAERAAAAQQGQDMPADWYRRKALGLIALNQNIKTGTGWTVFMPGSWAFIDDLNARVKERFEREFGEIAVAALERQMVARVSTLTGVGRDPSTGQLIIGDDCAAPAGARSDALAPASLAIDDLPQMRALQLYVNNVDQFDAALQALQRLQQPSSGNADALRLVVRYALGAELQGSVADSVPYFHRARAGRDGVASTDAGVDVNAVRQAFRCTLDKGAQQLDNGLFANNPLLTAERGISEHLNGLGMADGNAGDITRIAAGYRAVVAGVDTQRELLASGKGGWLHQAQFMPGAVYDRTLSRIAQNRLLGADLANQMRQRDDTGFQAFRSELALRFGGADSGVVWSDKDARYTVSPGRAALRDALSNLLNQPFMIAPRDRELPTLVDGTAIVWDRTQLDQALALGDMRKRFLTDGLVNLPATARPAVETALDQQFARLLIAQTASAANIGPAAPLSDADTAAFDAARARIARIGALLTELGASAQIDELNSLVSDDAMQHLQRVDEGLSQSELYATRQDLPDTAHSTRAPILAAFGVNDAAGLAPYLDQQAQRALALGKQAATYLAALDSADAASPLAQRWQAIERDLERYRLKNPNSSLLRLEQFALSVAADPNGAGCMSKFSGRVSSGGGDDYFATLHARLYDRLLARCRSGYVFDLRQEWGNFASAFNESVAGRLPFESASMQPVAARANAATPTVADFGELGQVLKRYDAVSETFHASGSTASLTNNKVRQFIDNFDQVKTLLAPLYPSDDGAPNGYDLNVEFRVNRNAEVAGNQMIDWTLTTGSQSLSMNDTPRTLHWDFGTPVVLTVHFAKDSPLAAAADPQQRGYSTDGRTLTWQFNDPWALISFVNRERVADAGPRGDRMSQLLRLEFPLSTANPADLSLLPKQARGRLFMRVTLMPAGKKTPLPWPGSFPVRAPEWSAL